VAQCLDNVFIEQSLNHSIFSNKMIQWLQM
jgi:hypothetical protein